MDRTRTRFRVITAAVEVPEGDFHRADRTARDLAEAGSCVRVIETRTGTCWGWYFPRRTGAVRVS